MTFKQQREGYKITVHIRPIPAMNHNTITLQKNKHYHLQPTDRPIKSSFHHMYFENTILISSLHSRKQHKNLSHLPLSPFDSPPNLTHQNKKNYPFSPKNAHQKTNPRLNPNPQRATNPLPLPPQPTSKKPRGSRNRKGGKCSSDGKDKTAPSTLSRALQERESVCV
jgi:hypothetical protein